MSSPTRITVLGSSCAQYLIKEDPVARAWRLRHKLVLSLTLVVASVGLLLGAAVFGLTSYLDAIRTTDRKVDEIQQVAQLRDHIHQIAAYAGPDNRADEKAHIDRMFEQSLQTLRIYKQTLQSETLRQRLDPDEGETELACISRLEKSFETFRERLERAAGPQIQTTSSPESMSGRRLLDESKVRESYDRLTRESTDLLLHISSDIKVVNERSMANHRRSISIAGFATVLAIVLVLTLLYYFRIWIFKPLKQLQAGVSRVKSGIFDNPICLNSKDELEELGNEFDAMTVRLSDVCKSLASQVNERTRQLVRSERMVSVGFLAAGVAHEINNPLASIAFCAEALERRLHDLLGHGSPDGEVIEKYLKMMQDESQRCKQITQKLLDFSRSGGKREAAEVAQLVQDVVEVAECLPNARGKSISFEPQSYVMAPISVPDIKGVVLNLVVNALDSMDEGGHLRVVLQAQEEYAELRFIDSGCGMTAEVLENIFEPFFTRNRTGNGTGLGLSISHQIIDQHGGTISATSAGPGKGSTFLVRLPLRATNTAEHGKEGTIPFPTLRAA
jgi:two-component system, NtrC family, sensor kinase